MTRLVFEHQRGHLRRERSHAMSEGFTTARPLSSHYEFAAMFAAFADLVTFHDLDGTIRLASDSSRSILGLAPDELIGRMPAETFLSPEDLPLLDAAIDRLLKGEDTVAVTFRVPTETSPAEWLEARIGAVRGLKGSATGFVAVSRVVTGRVETELRHHERLERYRQITDAVPGMTAWVIDRELRCRFAAGAGFPSITGPDACVGRPLAQLLSADRFETARRHLEECFAGRTVNEESSRPGRHQFWSRYLPVATSSGAVEEVLVVNLEVTDRERTHEALRRSEASFSSAFDNSPIGMAIIAPDESLLRANDAFCALTKRSREELHRGSWSELIHPDDVESNRELTGRMLAGERRTAMVERRYLRPDHSVVHTVMSITLVRDEVGRPLHLVTQVLDVTDRHRLEAYLEELVLRDPLTGAHNRRALDVELARRLAVESAESPSGALVLFDIDNFKDMNDTFGHDVGDDVLRHLVSQWRERLRRSDVLVRIGGDEFVVLLGDGDPDSVESVARDLLTLADGAILTVTGVASSVSAGMALFRPDENPAQLLRRADDALYLAKRAGRGRLVVDPTETEL
jgi:diguanylate cyclase (GGDEF)-like protein/PAS domain S-box-containing protein